MLENRQNKGLMVLALTFSLLGCEATPTTTQQTKPVDSAASIATANPATAASEVPLVVATNTILCDLTKQIAATTVNLQCLIQPGSDPHVYQAKPGDRKAIEQAKLILYGGYDFEPELIKLIKATSNPATKVAVNELAVPNPQKFAEDGKTVTDPHVWHNAQNGVAIAKVIGDSLSKLKPENANLYSENTQKVTNEISKIDTWIKSEVATIPPKNRKLVTTHDALGYYAQAYGIPVEQALGGISTEAAPTAARVSALVKDIQKTGVPTIFAEVTNDAKLITAVAKNANVKVSDRELYADSLGEAGSDADTYQKMLIANTQSIVEGLGGKYTPFGISN
ncbi:zinc ABC transporter substrate-binding protein [Calothrix sp. FACHB-1219]|uniref:metal ABC transporter solute-binding protein, Zn/Mn family n=1 Tax=unclassified Calothrix TaxID=2619626 RepID=UPI00168670C1|nr:MULTISPECIES: zinc ABC transporter substrate-binding protein [unclassified Calothrix]MBD2205805.1 zinc ABC transporter substrate-binding protein [Calothrix sp. FACHB-168]MBD2220634.1 zinc ABC transporter substrate-binding protein [Calothrix sp. FACHB-1219]